MPTEKWLDLATQGASSLVSHQLEESSSLYTGQKHGWPLPHSLSLPTAFPPPACSGLFSSRSLEAQASAAPALKKQQQQQNGQRARVPKLSYSNTFCSNKTSERKHISTYKSHSYFSKGILTSITSEEAKFISFNWNHFPLETGMLRESLSLSKCDIICFRSPLNEFNTDRSDVYFFHN